MATLMVDVVSAACQHWYQCAERMVFFNDAMMHDDGNDNNAVVVGRQCLLGTIGRANKLSSDGLV